MDNKPSYNDFGFAGQNAAPMQNQAIQALFQQLGQTQQYAGAYGQGAGMLQQQALGGSPTLGAANQSVQNTLNGDYLSGGAGFNASVQAAVDQANKTVMPELQSRFEMSGAPTSALAQQAATNTLGQTVGDIYAQNYQDERSRQMQAAGLAPELNQANYFAPEQLMKLGMAPSDAASGILGQINAGKTQPTYSNQWMGILGGLLGGANAGASLYNQFNGGAGSSGGNGATQTYPWIASLLSGGS